MTYNFCQSCTLLRDETRDVKFRILIDGSWFNMWKSQWTLGPIYGHWLLRRLQQTDYYHSMASAQWSQHETSESRWRCYWGCDSDTQLFNNNSLTSRPRCFQQHTVQWPTTCTWVGLEQQETFKIHWDKSKHDEDIAAWYKPWLYEIGLRRLYRYVNH